MGRFPLSHAMGISHVEKYFHSGDTFLSSLWCRGNGFHRGDGPFTTISATNRINDIEALEERRQVTILPEADHKSL